MLIEWQQWLRASGAQPTTIQTRVRAVQALMAHSGSTDPMTLTAVQVTAWLADCRAQWTRKTYWHSAQSWFGWLVEQDLRADNPMVRIPRPKAPRNLPRPVSDAVVEAMLTNPISGRCLEYTTLAVLAGLRAHEVAKVHGTDVDIASGLLFVLGKGQQAAFLPLHPRIAMLARGKPADDYWFPSTRPEGHVRATSVSATLKRGLAAAGAHNATPHQLRHSYGTAVLRQSRDLRVTQELLRHRSAASTQVYTQVATADKVAAIGHLPWTA